MRILLRKIHGVLGAVISTASGRVMLAHPPGMDSMFAGFTLSLLRPLMLIACLLSIVLLLLTVGSAPSAAATPAISPAADSIGGNAIAVERLLPVMFIGSIDLFSTSTMLGVVENLKRPNTGLLNRFFATLSQSQTEEIHFDVDEGRRYLAPLVSPLVAAPVKNMKGFRRDTFTPAYVKQKARWNPQRALRVQIGEAVGGSMSPDQRRNLAIANELQDQFERLQRRKEAMAYAALMDGQLTITGEDYPATVVDFGRHADLDVAANNLTADARWSQAATAYPMDNLDDLAEKTVKHSGSAIIDVVMDSDAYRAFRKNKKVERDFELPKYDAGSIQDREANVEGLVFKGMYGSYAIWLYTGFYTDANGDEQKTMSGGYVIGVGAIDGTQHQGAIQDEESEGYQPVEFFPKSWIEKDPSVRWIHSQSSPLVVPRRINACAVMKVLNNA